MKCHKKRTLFDLLTIYKCDNCPNYLKDEFIVIEGVSINIYYLNSRCKENDYDDDYIAFNKKIRIFLKEGIINRQSVIIIWINKEELNLLNDECLFSLTRLGKPLHIAVL